MQRSYASFSQNASIFLPDFGHSISSFIMEVDVSSSNIIEPRSLSFLIEAMLFDFMS